MSQALAKKMNYIREVSGLRSTEVASLLDTTPQTVSRWQTGKSQPHPQSLERLLALAWLTERLHEYYKPDEARIWLYSPHQLLSGERPVDRIQAGKLDDVLALIDQLDSGSFV